MERRTMRALIFVLLAGSIASEAIINHAMDFPMQQQQQQHQQMLQQNNHSMPLMQAANTAMPEGKKIESWLPSQPELMQMPLHQPSALTYPSLPNAPPVPPPFLPDNYYLPATHYGAPSTEFRSEHYPYPFEPNYPYPISQPPIDTSLVPTAKHFVIVSFIGLLLLFAIIQNSIAAAKRKDALVDVLSNRKKREIDQDFQTPEIQPDLSEDARIRCIQRTLCFENRKLSDDFGIFGKILANYITRNVQSFLKKFSPGWDRLVEDAARTGLRGADCNIVYKNCNLKIFNRSSKIEENEELL